MENNLEEKLSAILSDPDMMGKIQAMAQSLGQSPPPGQQPQPQSQPRSQEPQPRLPEIDLAALQKMSALAGQSGIDKNQQALLSALSPYLSRDRVGKLENAMRAAKMAKLASGFLGSGGLRSLMGR